MAARKPRKRQLLVREAPHRRPQAVLRVPCQYYPPEREEKHSSLHTMPAVRPAVVEGSAVAGALRRTKAREDRLFHFKEIAWLMDERATTRLIEDQERAHEVKMSILAMKRQLSDERRRIRKEMLRLQKLDTIKRNAPAVAARNKAFRAQYLAFWKGIKDKWAAIYQKEGRCLCSRVKSPDKYSCDTCNANRLRYVRTKRWKPGKDIDAPVRHRSTETKKRGPWKERILARKRLRKLVEESPVPIALCRCGRLADREGKKVCSACRESMMRCYRRKNGPPPKGMMKRGSLVANKGKPGFCKCGRPCAPYKVRKDADGKPLMSKYCARCMKRTKPIYRKRVKAATVKPKPPPKVKPKPTKKPKKKPAYVSYFKRLRMGLIAQG